MRSPKSPNDDAWLRRALEDTDALLRDHAHAERKAAATAMGLVAQYADIPELVSAMTALAIEELTHFQASVGRRKCLFSRLLIARHWRVLPRYYELYGATAKSTATAASVQDSNAPET